MIQFSRQHKIVNDISLSFASNEKIHTKISNKILTRDKQFLNPNKYQTYTNANFKFITLWTVFKKATSTIDTLKALNNYNKNDITNIMKEKEKIMLYQNTFEMDVTLLKPLVVTHNTVLKLFNENKISCLYIYWYFQKCNVELTRLQKRTVNRVNFFMEFFPVIQTYLESKLSNY